MDAGGPPTDPHRRAALAELDDADRSLHVEELAERLVKRGETVIGAEEYERSLERTLISLHHNVLPRLAAAGDVDYDADANVVSPRSDEVADVDWLEEGSIDRTLATVDPDLPADDDSVGVIRGRRTVIEHGRALADEAEEELFCMYLSTDLLEDECLRRAKDAIDRGVEMFVGTRDADVRDLTREHLPEATIWEPERGWLAAPAGYPTVGRLVLVDRRTVMLAMLDEPDSEGRYPEETALVGEGEENALVVLVRELLGPRLDHLDYQSADFQTELHS